MFALRALRNTRILLALVLTAATLPSRAHAQATSTASKSMDISLFGGYTNQNSDYGKYRDDGFVFGANITRYSHFIVKPSIETRFSFANGPTVNEHAYLAGVRGQYELGRVHPYMDFLAGAGHVSYNNFTPGVNDRSYHRYWGLVLSPGGGVDIDVFRNVQLKADFQGQFWHMGPNYTLTPEAMTFGVAYRIPFHPDREHATQ